ncbi:hypothetical protein Aab01nite_80470 [Paractinoplanes abujensis]|uniref:Uncharacterized protein n=1 Tax=Paractinoplanes abujensis TaxID=882441 RepID=A0A7W7CU06_9ACTN|nr:hypothetical protein [Actinoplanes abujensis]MBB4693258.1 hypothetical protein [Actinoplanes abujensis]GID24457.1 hypothetical protein Aab01nite_80470 [Actinoplanes abujensis]
MPPPTKIAAAQQVRQLLHLDLVRSEKATVHLTTFVVSAVSTILITRAFLALTGYPQIGGDTGLHIAHVLPGGLLMLAGLVTGFAFIGRGPRPVAALLGGVGFGLFIDEVGKFVTADNDYFFEPAPAIMYVVFVTLVVAAQAGRRRRPLSDQEKVANAAHVLVDGLAGRLPDRRRQEVLRTLDAISTVKGAQQLRDLLADVEPRVSPLPQRFELLWHRVTAALARVASSRFAVTVVATLLVLQALGATAVVVSLWRANESYVLVTAGTLTGTAVCLICTTVGLWRWRTGAGRAAVEWLQRSALTSLLVTQVFHFAASQFTAVAGLGVDLLLLGVTSSILRTRFAPP